MLADQADVGESDFGFSALSAGIRVVGPDTSSGNTRLALAFRAPALRQALVAIR